MFDLLQSLSSTSSESDGSDSDDELPESMQPVCMQRNSKQNAVIGEFTPRLAQCKLPGIDSPTSESAPSEEVSPQLLTKKPSKPLQDASPKPGAAPSEKAAPAVSPTQELSTRRVVWLMIKNIPEAEQTISLEFKNNDIVRWLDFDPKHLESEPASLPVDRYLECETWSGKPVVVPSEYARRISSTLELAQVLQRRPRAEVIEDFVGTGDDDLSVGAGEVIYLLFECDSTYFMAMNKGLTRGRVPKSVLNVLVAP
ncbi:hypothetical protein ECG_08129 [Echinococcus granulosus]|nr:hypothetical protein ECG_08129 [Echinococcus granulosus]